MTRIAILKEKHADRYFDVTTDEQLHNVALYILRQRYEQGYWYAEPTPPEALDFEASDIEKAPVSLRDEMQKRLKSHQRELQHYEQEKDDWDAVTRAISTNDGRLAFRILRDRNNYEYEGFEITWCEKVQ